MNTTTKEDIEAIARSLCDERWGEGTYDTPGTVNRSYWRREARRLVQSLIQEHRSSLTTYEAQQ